MAPSFVYLPTSSPHFPRLLAEIPQAPAGLFAQGTLPAGKPVIAIVGTRRATPQGCAIARKFAHELAARGFIIVSGLAFGIDAAAHQGCLDAGGQTVAVLPCGINHAYPRSHARLAERVAERGALVSEYPPGTEPLPYRFLERNRIVSGMASATLIIEAPEKSGALATARFAAEQGRECLVIPGPITHPNYAGSHELIRNGAQLAASISHVLEAYGAKGEELHTDARQHAMAIASEDERKIYQTIKASTIPLDVDKIINITKLQPQVVNQALAILVIKKIIEEKAGGYMLH